MRMRRDVRVGAYCVRGNGLRRGLRWRSRGGLRLVINLIALVVSIVNWEVDGAGRVITVEKVSEE